MIICGVHGTPLMQVPDSLQTAPSHQESDTVLLPTEGDTVPSDTPLHVQPAVSPAVRHEPVADSLHREYPLPKDTLGEAYTTSATIWTLPSDSLAHETSTDSLIKALTHFPQSDKGFFCDTPYWHPELSSRTQGFPCTRIPYGASSDSMLTCGVLLCFVMLIYILCVMVTRCARRCMTSFSPHTPVRDAVSHKAWLRDCSPCLSSVCCSASWEV